MKYPEYKENKQHGSRDFPIQYYALTAEHPQYVMPLHWHPEWELIRVVSGQLALYLNNDSYVLTAGDVVLAGGGVLHRAEPDACVYECVVFDPKMLSRYAGAKGAEVLMPLMGADGTLIRTIAAKEPLYAVATELMTTLAARPVRFEWAVSGLLALMVYHLGDTAPASRQPARQQQTIAQLLAWIEQNLAQRITLGQLAAVAAWDEKYLCRRFRELTGHTPIDYINRLRIERACYAMTAGGKNITEAAMDCGFNELSYFSRTFKRYMGVTPREFCRKG